MQPTPDARFVAASANEAVEAVEADEPKPIVKPAVFKKRKKPTTGALSFQLEEADERDDDKHQSPGRNSASSRPKTTASQGDESAIDTAGSKKRLKPNAKVNFTPTSQSKTALAKDAQLKQALQKEYMEQQEKVRACEFVLPFVFFDGKITPGGQVRMRKGDHIWLFLERARKVGAEMAGKTNSVRKDWARISVDDLIVVRQDLILPAHFDFHYFILNRTVGYHGPLFTLSSEPTPDAGQPTSGEADSTLEGYSHDPAATKVVDRRWYEKNKHIYPASVWEAFDPERDYSQGGRKDREGNQMFFSQ